MDAGAGSSNPSSSKDRKHIEKDRRDRMKLLYADLRARIPRVSPKGSNSTSNQLNDATDYIKATQERIEEMKKKKARLMGGPFSPKNGELRLPDIEIHATGSTVQLVLITGIQYMSMFKQVIGILHNQGANVVSANYSVVGQTVYHTLQAQVGSELLVPRLSEILKKFVYDIDLMN